VKDNKCVLIDKTYYCQTILGSCECVYYEPGEIFSKMIQRCMYENLRGTAALCNSKEAILDKQMEEL